MRHRAAVALGSNLGDRLSRLRSAMEAVSGLGEVVGISSLYETAPLGGPEQDPYLNSVVVIGTDLDAGALLDALLSIEEAAGRVRAERWGPRTLDLDLITMVTNEGEVVASDGERLSLPHPRAGKRRFVLEPLAELWPDAPLRGGETAESALQQVRDQKVEVLGRSWTSGSTIVPRLLVALQAVVLVAFAVVFLGTGDVGSSPLGLASGVMLMVGGGLLAVAGARTLGPSLSPLPEPRPGSSLVVSGPYRFVRHPIYTGVILLVAGVAVAAGSGWVWLGAGLVGVFFWAKAVYEESRCRIAVAGYPDYQRSVRGRLFPVPFGPV